MCSSFKFKAQFEQGAITQRQNCGQCQRLGHRDIGLKQWLFVMLAHWGAYRGLR